MRNGPDDIYSMAFLSIYQTDEVTPGRALISGNKVFLNPADAQQIRINLMNLHEEATNGPAPDNRKYRQRPRHAQPEKRQPLLARIAAGIIIGGLILWGVVACTNAVLRAEQADHCRASLIDTLRQSGSERQPTLDEIDACVRNS